MNGVQQISGMKCDTSPVMRMHTACQRRKLCGMCDEEEAAEHLRVPMTGTMPSTSPEKTSICRLDCSSSSYTGIMEENRSVLQVQVISDLAEPQILRTECLHVMMHPQICCRPCRMSSFAIIFSSFSSKQLTMSSKRQGEENTPSRVQHGTS